MSTITLFTAEQLLHMPSDGFRYELLSGELHQMSPAGWRHGKVGGRLYRLIATYLDRNPCGEALLAETGFLLSRDPDTVCAPDIAFIRNEHIPLDLPEDAFWPGAPDLAVEVVSPGDTYREVNEKANAWLTGGAQLIWIVNPLLRTVSVYHSDGSIVTLTENEELTAEDVLPGFRCRVGDIFAGQ